MTIIEAALTVLKAANKSLTRDEIYDAICRENLFDFKAQDPKSILNAQLRKNTLGYMGKSGSPKPLLRQLDDKKFGLL